VHAGSARAVEKQHAKGKKTARERIEALLDEGSFVELDELARHRSTNFGMEATGPTATAWSPATAPSTAAGLRLLPGLHGLRRQPRRGLRREDRQGHGPRDEDGCPVIGINDSGGARIQEGVVSLGLYGEIFRRNVHASGVIPQISLIMGPRAGGASTPPRSPTSP
jgi:propionyl-CoA carboxylase beta chain